MPRGDPGDLKFVSAEVLAASTALPPDRDRKSVGKVEASTLLHPFVLDQEREAWIGY